MVRYKYDLFLMHFEKETQRQCSSDGSLGFVFKRGFGREMEGQPLIWLELSAVLSVMIAAAELPILKDDEMF